MDINYLKLAEAAIVITAYILLKVICYKIIDRTMRERYLQKSRGQVIKRAVNLTFIAISISFLLVIWGVNQSDLVVFLGSVLTVIGVAMFAQWSILSNITSSIIIFFNHSVKINDTVIIMEAKDYEIEGTISNIGLFFITLETVSGEDLTLPNNVFLQKTVKKKTKS